MGGTGWPLPAFWAQATVPTASNPTALAGLALRRWFSSLTLSSPEAVPSLFGLWAWLAGLLAVVAAAVVFQGPARALGQVLDVPGNVRLAAAALQRLRRSGRVIAAVVGMTVLSWTAGQSVTFHRAAGRDDLTLLTRSRGLAELSLEQGVLAALTPLRDVAGLGSNVPLLCVAVVLLFRASADSWGVHPLAPGLPRRGPVSGWATVAWVCGALLVVYRMVSLGGTSADIPLGGLLTVEALVIPAVMAVCDGLLLGWVLVGLRQAGLDGDADDPMDARGAAALVPAAALACLAVVPARYLATAVLLGSEYLPASALASAPGAWMRWVLGRGLVDIQAAALPFAGLAGAVAWGAGDPLGALRGYARMLRADGGRLAAVLGLAGLAAGAGTGAAYLAVLSLPASTWVLAAADSYAHYATLPVGLWTLAAFIELGGRSRPDADPPTGDDPDRRRGG